MVHLWSYLLSHVIDAIIKITVPSVSRKYILCYLLSITTERARLVWVLFTLLK